MRYLDDRIRLLAVRRADRVYDRAIKQGVSERDARFLQADELSRAQKELRGAHRENYGK